MAIYPRGNWYWMSYTVNGEQKKESTKVPVNGTRGNEKLAEAIHAKKLVEIAEGRGLNVKRKSKLTLEELSKLFLAWHKVNQVCNTSRFRIVSCSKLWKMNIDEITQIDIECFINEFLKDRKESTANHYIVMFKVMFFEAKDRGYTDNLPADKIKCFKEGPKKERVFTHEEFDKIYSLLPNQTAKDAFMCLRYTGLRKMELLNRTWSDIDFDLNVIKVEERKNDKPLYAPMNEITREIMIRRKLNKGSGNYSDTYIFQSPLRVKPYLFAKSFQAARKAAKLTHIRIHDIRHTYASELASDGEDIGMIKELLGHENIESTFRYAKYNPDSKLRATRRLDKNKARTDLVQSSESQKENEFQKIVSQIDNKD